MIDLSRSAALLGETAMVRLQRLRIAVIGVGGVGSWCAEALVRTGACHLTLIDDDLVAPSNANRQCPATQETIGQAKVEAMRTRLLAINPAAEIAAKAMRIHGDEDLSDYDVIVDAIDSVDCKAELILNATAAKKPIVSSMGAALRLDPTKVAVKRFDKIEGDGLARALRQRFRRLERFPSTKFTCVCSTELPLDREVKGSVMPVTCAFGMALAAEVVKLVV